MVQEMSVLPRLLEHPCKFDLLTFASQEDCSIMHGLEVLWSSIMGNKLWGRDFANSTATHTIHRCGTQSLKITYL